MDEALNDRDDVGVLGPNVDHEGAFQPEEVGGKHGGLVHEEAVELVLLEEEFDEFLAVLLAAEGGLDVEHGVLGGIDQQFFAQGEVGHGLEALPVVNEAVLQDALGVGVLPREAVEEVQLGLLTGGAVDLDILGGDGGTEGATRSGLSLPAKPILVLRDPTSMMRGIP